MTTTSLHLRARKEAQQAFGGADKQLGAATTEIFSASALPIVEAVLNESLRAMPPVPAISRIAPGYRHFPVSRVTLRPKHGLPLLLTQLQKVHGRSNSLCNIR